jgi:hypothetical protein
MVNTNDKTEQQRDFEQRQRAKEDRVVRAQGEGAAHEYLGSEEMPEDTSTFEGSGRLRTIHELLFGGMVAAFLFAAGAFCIKSCKDNESVLNLVNPEDAYSMPSESTPKTQADYSFLKKTVESDDIMSIARENAAARMPKMNYLTQWQKQFRLNIGLPAENPQPAERVSKFSIEGYFIGNNDTLSQIAERYQTRYGMKRTIDEIADLNNAILTGEGLDILAECYGISEEEMRKQAGKMPKEYMRYIDDKNVIWSWNVLPIPFIPKE